MEHQVVVVVADLHTCLASAFDHKVLEGTLRTD